MFSFAVDHVATTTLAFIPLTIIGMPIENMELLWVTLAVVAMMPIQLGRDIIPE